MPPTPRVFWWGFLNTEKKPSTAFINYFSKIIRQIKENAVYLLLDRKRFSLYAPYFLPTNRNVHLQHTTNQNSYDVKTVFTYSNLNIPTDQIESAHYPNYFMIAIFSFSDPTPCLESYNVSLLMSIKWTPVYWGKVWEKGDTLFDLFTLRIPFDSILHHIAVLCCTIPCLIQVK